MAVEGAQGSFQEVGAEGKPFVLKEERRGPVRRPGGRDPTPRCAARSIVGVWARLLRQNWALMIPVPLTEKHAVRPGRENEIVGDHGILLALGLPQLS